MITRRAFGFALSGAVLMPGVGRSQSQRGMKRLGIAIGPARNLDSMVRLGVFESALKPLGWSRGDNLDIEIRWSDADRDKMRENAREIVAWLPDVILAQSTPMVKALRNETRSIPIVFVNVSDPVGSGFVASFARPDGNITGFTDIEPSLASKWVELLKTAAPQIGRMALLFNPETAPDRGMFFLKPFQAAATSIDVTPLAAPVHDMNEVATLLATLGREPRGGLVVQAESFPGAHIEEITSLARQFRVPAIYPYRFYTARGGMMSYGSDALDLFRRAAGYIDRVLKGERSEDLPVQAPTKFELVINANTAKTIGLTISPSLLARADEVIE